METIFELKSLDVSYNHLAPDKSEIRVLTTLESGGLCHCTLPVGRISQAVKHWLFTLQPQKSKMIAEH